MAEHPLKHRFFELNANAPTEIVERCWHQIHDGYMESQRHYHTLTHIENLFREFDHVKHQFKNSPVVELAIFYHDLVYQPGAGDNEERSATAAAEAMAQLNWKEKDIREVAAFIRATAIHIADTSVLNPGDLALFLDLDLSILGSDWDTYRSYAMNILREFGNNAMVKWGRRGFMERFLGREHLYHTDYYRKKLEAKARENIRREINEMLR